MNAIWFLSEKNNILINGFNKVQKKNGDNELWVKEVNGASRKVAIGVAADKLEDAMLNIVWETYPAIIMDENDRFATNVNIKRKSHQEVE